MLYLVHSWKISAAATGKKTNKQQQQRKKIGDFVKKKVTFRDKLLQDPGYKAGCNGKSGNSVVTVEKRPKSVW